VVASWFVLGVLPLSCSDVIRSPEGPLPERLGQNFFCDYFRCFPPTAKVPLACLPRPLGLTLTLNVPPFLSSQAVLVLCSRESFDSIPYTLFALLLS